MRPTEKAKLAARRGRKATGLSREIRWPGCLEEGGPALFLTIDSTIKIVKGGYHAEPAIAKPAA